MGRSSLALLRAVTATLIAVVVGVLTGGYPARAAVQLPHYDHIVIVVEENHAASQIIGNKSAPFINARVLTTVVPFRASSGCVPRLLLIIDLRESPTNRGTPGH